MPMIWADGSGALPFVHDSLITTVTIEEIYPPSRNWKFKKFKEFKEFKWNSVFGAPTLALYVLVFVTPSVGLCLSVFQAPSL